MAILALTGLLLLYTLAVQLKRVRRHPGNQMYLKDFSLKITATCMGLCLVIGTILYFYVFRTISESDSVTYTLINDGEPRHVKFNNTELFLRSLICSLDLFMLDVDSNILDRLDDKPLIKALISFQAVLSFSCTVVMLVSLGYSRLNAYFKLSYRTKIDRIHNHLYIFFGANEPSENLINDILKAEHDPYAVVILIDEANVKDDEINGWEGVVNLVTHRHKPFEISGKHSSVRVAIAGKPLCEIGDDITSMPDFDVFEYMGLERIKRLIEKLKDIDDAQLHIFFLNENEDRNIRDILTLAKDRTILSIADANIFHRIYCHARYNGPNRVIQDVAVRKKLNIRIIDSSHLAVERLKLLPEFHPVNTLEMDSGNPGTVSESFDALIIGFGEVGRDAFRFLYEFGAFVNNDATATEAHRSPFNCTIVDKAINEIKGTFKAAMPGIFKDTPSNTHIEFEDLDYNHERFYTEVLKEDRIVRLNYVVISIGENDEAIALATRIFNRFRRYGGDMKKLRILVRCTDDSKVESVKKIADHYNFGYGEGLGNNPVIHIFGQPEETYTYDLVISDRIIGLGKEFHENYRLINQEEESWNDRHDNLTNTPVPKIDKLRRLRRKESQDIANALHIPTKMAFFEKSLPAALDRMDFMARYFKYKHIPNRCGCKSAITYPYLTELENLIILRLAMLEHLRWNAAHELLGYVRRTDGKTGCDEESLCHNCLRDWNQLDAESNKTEATESPCDYKEFDFTVVETTIALAVNPNPVCANVKSREQRHE